MRSQTLMLILLCFGTSPLFSGSAIADNRPVIRLAADNWCPYNCQPGAEQPGYVIELAQELFGQSGYQVEYLTMPWARVLQSLTSGQEPTGEKASNLVTAAIGATLDELPEALFPAEPIGYFHGHFMLASGSDWNYRGPESLQGMQLGVINGYDYGTFNQIVAAQHDRGSLVVLSGDDAIERGLGMLVRGRLDAFLEDLDVARYTARQLGMAASVKVGDPVAPPIALYLAFSRVSPEAEHYARLWTDGIQAMRASGRLAEILARYGVADWQ